MNDSPSAKDTGKMAGRDLPEANPEIALQVSSSDELRIDWGSTLTQNEGDMLEPFTLERNCYGLIFVSRGTLRVAVDSRQLVVCQGQTLVLRPGEECAGTEPHKTGIFCPWLAFAVKHSGRGSRKRCISVPRIANTPDPYRLAEMFLWISEDYRHAELRNELPMYTLSTQHLLLSLLSRLDPTEQQTAQPTGPQAALAERARDYIRMHILRNNQLHVHVTSDMVAEALNCSGGYLRTAFRNTFGQGISDFVLDMRMHWARRNLAFTRMSIGQIAGESGFSNLNNFTRMFTRVHGMSPSQWRAAHARHRVDGGI